MSPRDRSARRSLERSLDMQSRAQRVIPGMTQLLSKRPDQFSAGVWPGYFQRALGDEVWDLDGNRYVDMSIAGIGANVLGYADRDVDEAVRDAIRDGSSSSLNCPEEVLLAERLVELHAWAEMVRFTRSGGEAMALAVRVARAHKGRERIAFCGYHGWHDWYLAANLGDHDALRGQLLPGLEPAGVPASLRGTAVPFRYNHLQELENIVHEHGSTLAAVVMEPLRDTEPEPGFLEGCHRLARECGAVLIFDEVSAGFRMNTGGAHLRLGVDPDVAVFSKALGNGYAIAAIIGRGSVMRSAEDSFISSTNWTERLGPAAALAVIEKHARLNVGERLVALGRRIQNGWTTHAKRHGIPIHVGGIPPLSKFTFEVEEPFVLKALFVQEMLDRGYLASTLYYAMYAHTDEHVEGYLSAVDEVFSTIAPLLRPGHARGSLRGEPAAPGFKRLA
jgi:glutamate-1-semialdehyde 2,1-aminomutase